MRQKAGVYELFSQILAILYARSNLIGLKGKVYEKVNTQARTQSNVMRQASRSRFSDLRVKLILQTYVLLSGVVGWAPVTKTPTHTSPSSTPYAMDAKEARAWAVQVEHTKLIIAEAAFNFERSLHQRNLASCERQLTQNAVVSLNGVRMSGCEDLIDARLSHPTSTRSSSCTIRW
jgi:hypothetical protein